MMAVTFPPAAAAVVAVVVTASYLWDSHFE